ncbi:endo-beta-N-acetylglucosaminidase [Dolosigranulum savutiense]|uniref:Bacterial Ig-like domain-containing protein n=1 Tax=Dolosigranulum savutiense TaxID=3110288 RepID=A0AB74TQ78_9LACT
MYSKEILDKIVNKQSSLKKSVIIGVSMSALVLGHINAEEVSAQTEELDISEVENKQLLGEEIQSKQNNINRPSDSKVGAVAIDNLTIGSKEQTNEETVEHSDQFSENSDENSPVELKSTDMIDSDKTNENIEEVNGDTNLNPVVTDQQIPESEESQKTTKNSPVEENVDVLINKNELTPGQLEGKVKDRLIPKELKQGLEDILEWEAPSEEKHDIYRSTVPLTERKKGHKINELASEDAKVQSLAYPTPSNEGHSVTGGGEQGADVYAFDHWQYLDSFVDWGSLIPAPDITDEAHRNGVPVYGTIFFNWSTSSEDRERVKKFLQKDEDGTYPVARKLVELAQYYNFEGYFINQETSMPNNEGYSEEFDNFMRYAKEYAAEKNHKHFNFSWYDSMSEAGQRYHGDAVDEYNQFFMRKDEAEKNSVDEFFMNFNWRKSQVDKTVENMRELGRDPYDAYAGWELQKGGYTNTQQKVKDLVDEKGIPKLSLGLFVPDIVMGSVENFEDFHKKEQGFWTGFKGDPSTSDDSNAWSGIARFVVDKTPILEPLFHSTFNTGHGRGWYVDGKKVSNNAWNSRGVSSVMPTWRWWIQNKNSELKGSYDFDDAYNGGSSIKFSGKLNKDAQSDAMLYATNFTATEKTQLSVTHKGTNAGKVQIGVSTAKDYNEDSFKYFDLEVNEKWGTSIADLSELAGQQIYALKLRVTSGQATEDYQLNLGALSITENNTQVEAPTDVKVIERQLMSSRQSEAIISYSKVEEAATYEVYQQVGDQWEFVNASSSNLMYLPRLRRTDQAEGVIQKLKVVAIGQNGLRSDETIFDYNWGLTVRDTTEATPDPANINLTAKVIGGKHIDLESTELSTEGPANILSGTINNTADKWYSDDRTDYLDIGFEDAKTVKRFVIEHAGAGGEDPRKQDPETGQWKGGSMNTKDFNLEYKDLETGAWKVAKEIRGNIDDVTDVELENPITAKEWRLNVLVRDNGTPWGGLRIYNWKMYDQIKEETNNVPMKNVVTLNTDGNHYEAVFREGTPGHMIRLYADKEATKELASGTITATGALSLGFDLEEDNDSGLVYYRSQQEGKELSNILAVPYTKQQRTISELTLDTSNFKADVDYDQKWSFKDVKLTVSYEGDRADDVISLANPLVSLENFDPEAAGEQIVTVRYGNKKVTQTLPISRKNEPDWSQKVVASIEITTKPKHQYEVGEELNLSQGVATITYEDGTKRELSLDSEELERYDYDDFDLNKAGKYYLAFSIGGKWSDYLEIEVTKPTVNFQTLNQSRTQLEQLMERESFDSLSEALKNEVSTAISQAKELDGSTDTTQAVVDEKASELSRLITKVRQAMNPNPEDFGENDGQSEETEQDGNEETPDQPEKPGTGEDDEEIEPGQPTPPIEEEQPQEVIKDYFKLVVDFDGEQVVYDRKDSDVWLSVEQAREVYDQYLPEVLERDGKEYKRVEVTFTQSDEEAVLTYVYRTDDYEPTPEPEPEVYAGDYEFELTLDGESSTETLTFASRDKALDFVAMLNRLYKAAGYQLIHQDNGLPGEYKISLSFEKIVDKQPDITPEPVPTPAPEADKPSEELGVEEEPMPDSESPGTEAEDQQPDENEERPQPEQPAEPEVAPEAKSDTVEATFTFTNTEGAVHRGSLGEFANLEQAERRIRQYANELGYTLQNFRLVDGVFLADIEADLSEPLPEPEQPEETPAPKAEAAFEFTLENGSVHRGSLGEFVNLEQAERRIRHFANEQGYTLQNFRIEDGKFIADVTEAPQAASVSVWTLGVIGVTSLMSVLKKKD